MLSPTHRSRKDALVRLLGPAFIAAIAYVDPGKCCGKHDGRC